ncbi:N-acetylneuraminate synthase family protein [Desulfovermiculus halophilus]|uniref:N-acetylneuraminate synthase family protein n=1 Tax=Desulfovermiculus halophilus TaxID=339722 RepID=UPI00068814A0|nr:N-acetylneuraminate synthase family protein [Desulfovermiculus halophilus]
MRQEINKFFQIQDRHTLFQHKPYIIAEAGVNHEGSMELAKRLIDEAAEGGADAIKFQTYKADKIASKDSPAYWDLSKEPTPTQHALFQKYDKFWKTEFQELKMYCDSAGIAFLSTPFDLDSAYFLNDLVEVFKVSSSDITNKPFIEHICRYGKPIILSTGASDLSEIQTAKSWIDEYNPPLALLHCVLNYPTKDEDAHLGKIKTLEVEFPNNIIGYSDHTLPKDMQTLLAAALLGARIIEKHFTHDKTLPGNDHYHAMDVVDLKKFCRMLDSTWRLLGQFEIEALPNEELSRQHARRSLVAKRNILEGHVITSEDLTWKRPGHGISPKDIELVIGKRASKQIYEDYILTWSMFD